MRRLALILVLLLAARDAVAEEAPRRRWLAAGALAGGYAALTTWAYFAWYHDKPNLPAFRVGGDGLFGQATYAGGADKLGHLWANHAVTRLSTAVLRESGLSSLQAALIGGGLAVAFSTFVEIKDGFYYEFSPGDFAGDVVGVAAAVALDACPAADELLDVRVAYFPSARFRRSADLDFAEDYSGQTYLLALHLGALPGLRRRPLAPWTRLVDLTLGFETRGYKPDLPGEVEDRRQRVFVGLSLNLQGLTDLTTRGRLRTVAHDVFELAQPGFVAVPIVGVERSPDD